MKKEITGVMVYYYEVCKRKLWYFYNEIQMEQGNENVTRNINVHNIMMKYRWNKGMKMLK